MTSWRKLVAAEHVLTVEVATDCRRVECFDRESARHSSDSTLFSYTYVNLGQRMGLLWLPLVDMIGIQLGGDTFMLSIRCGN